MENQFIFPQQAHQAELQQLLRGDFKQFSRINVLTTNTGKYNNGSPFEIEGNGLLILPSYLVDQNGNRQSASTTARILIRFNHVDNDYLPFSLVANSMDFTAITLSIAKFWVWVFTPDGGNVLPLLITKGVTFGSTGSVGGVTGGGYPTGR